MEKSLLKSQGMGWNPEELPVREVTRIAVAGICRGAGASFVSGLLARQLAGQGRLTLAELGKSYFYAATGMEKRFAARPFAFYSRLIETGKGVKSVYNLEDGINWALREPGSAPEKEPSTIFRCFSSLPGDIVIGDCSGLERELSFAVLAEADKAVVVVDPMPSALFEAFDFIEDVRLRLPQAVIVVNKMNPGVHQGELRRFLGTRDYISLPLLPGQLLYKAEYNCMLPADMPEVQDVMGQCLKPLAERIIG